MRRLAEHLQQPLREHYWEASRHVRQLKSALRPENKSFRSVLAEDCLRYFVRRRRRPMPEDASARMEAAVAWLLRAQRATPDGGVSLGYFPCDASIEKGWRPSYPETTGYIIASLVDFGTTFARTEVLDRAFEMARWEADIQMPSGAVQGGTVCATEHQVPAVFNTGMVLHGLTAMMSVRTDERVERAARAAADFLVEDQDDAGHFQSHGKFVAAAAIKTYNCLCAWGLYRFGAQQDHSGYRDAAVKAVEASLSEQRPSGWFANNCLTRPNAPLTHTIGYTLQGILEVGALAGRDDFLAAVKRGLDPMLLQVGPDGYLAGRFYEDWKPAAYSVCVTGSAQLGIVAYRLYELFGEQRYREFADSIIGFVQLTQRLDVEDDGIHGAVPGSFPISGSYMPYGYPNWATKYFLDGLLLQRRLSL